MHPWFIRFACIAAIAVAFGSRAHASEEEEKLPVRWELNEQGDGAPKGSVAIEQVGVGLRISGRIHTNGRPSFPRDQTEMAGKDHVELWVNLVRAPELPPIGFANPASSKKVSSAAECPKLVKKSVDDCRRWYPQQVAYREQLKKLFTRHWNVAPGVVFEDYATAAYERINRLGMGMPTFPLAGLEPLKPGQGPIIQVLNPTSHGYEFEITLPWQSLPPSDSLEINHLGIRVDVVRSGQSSGERGDYSSTDEDATIGSAGAMSRIVLGSPRFYKLSPCEQVLGRRWDGEGGGIGKAYFMPGRELLVSDTMVFMNKPHPYQANPVAASPEPNWYHYVWKWMGGHEWLCGPFLSYTNGRETIRSDVFLTGGVLSNDNQWIPEAKKIGNGEFLIRSGPSVEHPRVEAGKCATCPQYVFRLFRMDSRLKLHELVNARHTIDCEGEDGADEQVSLDGDWNRLFYYRRFAPGPESDDDDRMPGEQQPWMEKCLNLKEGGFYDCKSGRAEPGAHALRFEKADLQTIKRSPDGNTVCTGR